MASSSTQNGSIVDFNTAMENFVAMFPELSTSQIEKVLRQNNGDVELTINDLLKLGNNCVEKQPPRRESATSCSTSSTHRNSCMSTANNHCEDDEKIALMLQNREFLRYLRSNDRFLRELDSDQHDYYPRQRHESVLSRCKRKEYGSWTMHEPPPMNPQDYEKCALPDGPLVDPCERPLNRLSKKIKSKFPSMESSSVPRPEDIYPHTVIVDYESGDDRFVQKLKNMSRNSKAMLLNLAKNFNVSKKQSALMPHYLDQNSDFTYDTHQSPHKFS